MRKEQSHILTHDETKNLSHRIYIRDAWKTALQFHFKTPASIRVNGIYWRGNRVF